MSVQVTPSSPDSFATEIAELLVQNETSQEDSARLSRDAARNAFLANEQTQVNELHDAARDAMTGALFGGAFDLAGVTFSTLGSLDQFKADTTAPCEITRVADLKRDASILSAVSKGFSSLSACATSVAGTRPSDDDKAEAKRYETLGEAAKWQADDASTELNKAGQLSDKLLGIVQNLNQDQSSAAAAIIGRI